MATGTERRERFGAWAISCAPAALAMVAVTGALFVFHTSFGEWLGHPPLFAAAAYAVVAAWVTIRWGSRAAFFASAIGVLAFHVFLLRAFVDRSGALSGNVLVYDVLIAAALIGGLGAGAVFVRPDRRARTAGLNPGDIDGLYGALKQEHVDRERVEQRLRDSEERYRMVAETATDAIICIDERGVITFVNPAAEGIFGYRIAEMMGQAISLLMPESMHGFHRASFDKYLVTGEKRMSWRNVELRARHRDGREIAVEMSLGEFAHDGRRQFTGIVRDISERKKEEALRGGQGRVLEMVATGARLTDILAELARLIESQAEGMLCSVLLLDESGARLRHGTAPSLPPDYVNAFDGVSIGPRAGSCGTAAYRGKMVVATDIESDPLWEEYRALALAHGLRACWSTPIVSPPGKVLGTFAMYYREVRSPSPAELRLISIATQIAGIAIERDRAHAALHEREARIRRLVDSNIIGVLFWDIDGNIWDANDAFLRMVRYTRVELLAGKLRWPEITPPEYHHLDQCALGEIASDGGCTPYEKEYLCKDGTRVPVLVGATLFENSKEKGVAFVLDLTERKLAEDRVRHLAQHDALTGLPNRLLFGDRVGQCIVQAYRSREQLAVMFIDLDRFKDINDTLGHQVGDRVLRSVARRLRRALREGDSVARLGGDEFVVCLPGLGLNASRDVMPIATKVLDALRRPFRIDGQVLHLTGSLGISLYPDNGKDADTLMRAADTAMYHAKEKGSDNYQFFLPQLNEAARRRLTIANRLREALRKHEFTLHYQPQIELKTGRVFSAEALIRWQAPELSPTAPAEFVKIAEETGLIGPLGEWVLREACQQLKRWRLAGHSDLRVAVNLSPHQLRRPGFAEMTGSILEETGLPASALEIEITEGLLMAYSTENVAALGRLARMGVRLAVDDFGTGYSSLSYLQRFPISALKVDRSFVSGIGLDPNDTAIVAAIVAMAESLQLNVVAEGVETAGQAAFLTSRGCFAAQGFYYSKPVIAAELSRMMGQRVEVQADAEV